MRDLIYYQNLKGKTDSSEQIKGASHIFPSSKHATVCQSQFFDAFPLTIIFKNDMAQSIANIVSMFSRIGATAAMKQIPRLNNFRGPVLLKNAQFKTKA